jgi:hypothetical protein
VVSQKVRYRRVRAEGGLGRAHAEHAEPDRPAHCAAVVFQGAFVRCALEFVAGEAVGRPAVHHGSMIDQLRP